METNVKNPLVVRCDYCGGDVSFDIAKQKYCCAHCGAETSVAEQKAQYRRWKRLLGDTVMQDIARVKSFTCPACGAQTIAAGEEVTARCPFCQNTMIDAEFAGNDLPEVIIPFKLSQEEAEARLRKWLQDNKGIPAAKVIEANMGHFTGCYLPYHIVRGAYNGSLQIRMHDGETDYPFRAYLNHTAVNASKDLDNLFLDGIEPFDFNDALEFSFGYLNRQKAKLQNIGGEELANRINEETRAELYEVLSKKVGTKEMYVDLGDEQNESIPALMPVYIVNCQDGIAAAVNGQTGKISVATGETRDTTRHWWVVPTIATLVVAIAGGWFGNFGLAFMGGLVFGMVFFAVAYTRHKKNVVNVVLTAPKVTVEHNDTRTEFIADFGNGPVPARLRFFTFGRILRVILEILIFIFLPVLIAIPIQLMRGMPLTDIQIGYGAAWYCIPGFVAIIMAGGVAKYMMYGMPIYYEILPGGKTKRRRLSSQRRPKLKEVLPEALSDKGTWKVGCLMVGILLFILIGSTLAMIY